MSTSAFSELSKLVHQDLRLLAQTESTSQFCCRISMSYIARKRPWAQDEEADSTDKRPKPLQSKSFSHISGGFIRKIQENEYIELSSLLPFVRNKFYVYQADKVDTVEKWQKAFKIYLAVCANRYPEKIYELVEYSETIALFAEYHHWDQVLSYDKQFWERLSKNPAMRWDQEDEELMRKLFYEEPLQRKVCPKFNQGCHRRYCLHVHRCSKCGLRSHGAFNYPGKS